MTSFYNKVLLSTPLVKDSFFHQSLVLIIKEVENSHIGLIINKTINETSKDIWSQINPELEFKEKPLKLGGPIQNSIILAHKLKKYSDYETLPNLYLSIEKNNIQKVLKNTSNYQMFLGYSLWLPDQLNHEMYKRGLWRVVNFEEKMVLKNNYDLWHKEKNKLSEDYIKKLGLVKQNFSMN